MIISRFKVFCFVAVLFGPVTEKGLVIFKDFSARGLHRFISKEKIDHAETGDTTKLHFLF